MQDRRATLEMIAPTVEEAINKGLSELGLGRDEVEIEILDEGSRGIFGLGMRQARVRLTVKTPTVEAESAISAAPTQSTQAFEAEIAEAVEAEGEYAPGLAEEQDERILQVARETVSELLHKMHVRAHVTARFVETEDPRHRQTVYVDISGKDLSILIGRQAERLNALQYIAALIISKEVGRMVGLIVDVQGYRQRREQQLRQLARRMAEQALRTGRRQVLEPMPANERRIIHMELRDHPQVTTESIGEEPRRKVTIIPK